MLGEEVRLQGVLPGAFRDGNGLRGGRFVLWGQTKDFVAVYARDGREVARVALDRPGLGTRDIWFVSDVDGRTLRAALDTFETFEIDFGAASASRALRDRAEVGFDPQGPSWSLGPEEAFLQPDGSGHPGSKLPLVSTGDGALELVHVSARGDLALSVRAVQPRRVALCTFAYDLVERVDPEPVDDRLLILPFALGQKRIEIDIPPAQNGFSLAVDERFAYLSARGEIHRYPRDGRDPETFSVRADVGDDPDWRLLANEDGVFVFDLRSSRLFRCVFLD